MTWSFLWRSAWEVASMSGHPDAGGCKMADGERAGRVVRKS